MSKVTPRDREEKLLAAIADGTAEELPTPRNRKEKLLKEIYDNGGGGGGGTSVTVDSKLSTTSKNPVQNKVITQALNEKGTYSKPTGGIPKTDLASEVQASLGKADNVSTLATEVDEIKGDLIKLSKDGLMSYRYNGNLENGGINDSGESSPNGRGYRTDFITCDKVCKFVANSDDIYYYFIKEYDKNGVYVRNRETINYLGVKEVKLLAGYKYRWFCTRKDNAYIDFDSEVDDIINGLILVSETIVKPYYGRKWVVVGDSITEYNNLTSKHYFDFISEKLGFDIYNMGSSGTGYKRTEDEGKAFYQRIENIPLDADVVTIFGSINDCPVAQTQGSFGTWNEQFDDSNTNNHYCACVNKTIDVLLQKIPNVRLGIISPLPNYGNYPSKDVDFNIINYMAEKLKEICYYRGIPFLDMTHRSNLRPWDNTQNDLFYENGVKNTHPNEKGHEMIANAIGEFVQTLIN